MEKTRIYQPNEVKKAAQDIKLGKLIAFPTETVYGLGADATNEDAVRKVFQAKGRSTKNPLNVTVSSIEMVKRFVDEISEDGMKLINKFWPGPLTLIFKVKPHSLSPIVTGGLKTAAFRMPDNQVTLQMIQAAQTPIVGPSANLSGKPSPTTAQHVLHDMDGKIAGIVDDGPTAVGMESTIIDLSQSQPTLIRLGAISAQTIETTLGKKVHLPKKTTKVPATQFKHYKPNAQILMVNSTEWQEAIEWAVNQNEKIGIMATDEILENIPSKLEFFNLGTDVTTASQKFFAAIRFLDNDKHVKVILAQKFNSSGIGEAYMNHLKKASDNQTLRLR